MMSALRLLIVAAGDDEVNPLVAALRDAGLDAVWTRVGTDGAATAAGDPRLDAILLGRAPSADAFGMLARLRDAQLDIPVIAVAPGLDAEQVAALMKAGAADYVSGDRLGAAVREACAKRRRRDETRRTEAAALHERRREGDAGFRLLFASNPLPMYVYDLETLFFLEVNDAAIEHYGYGRDEFLRMLVTDIRTPEDAARAEAKIAERRADPHKLRRSAGWRHRLKDGRIRVMETAAQALDFGGRRAVLVVATDITELTAAQARLRILHEIDRALIAAEEPAAIAQAALAPLRDLLGVPRVIVNMFDLDAGEAEWLAAAGRRRLHVGPGVRFPLHLMGDVEKLRKGEIQVVETAALPPTKARDALLASGVDNYMVVPMLAAGELIGAVSFGGAARDFEPEQVGIATEVAAQMAIVLAQARLRARITRQAEELEERVRERTLALTAAEREAAEANRAKSDFLSRMSHELRTPLNGILGFAQLLEMDVTAARDRESVGHILRGGRHLLKLIDEILDIARIEAGRLPISLEPVLVGEVVQNALDLVQPQAAARHITLRFDRHEGKRYAIADRQRLQQVLLNLLSNAIKYNRDGGAVTITCAERPTARLAIAVEDTGAGIAPEMLGRLFTPFDRLDADAGDVQGTGLGLALSKRLAEAMEGALLVESRRGVGTTFTVELAATASPDGPAREPDAAPFDGAAPSTRGTVLYIEDNVANLRLFERVVARRPGVELLSSMHGSRGLELARAHRPGLIVLDLHLPDLQGEEVLARLQDDAVTAGIPVVILSADATPGQVARLIAKGARAYLTKPLDLNDLLSLLDDVLAEPRESER